MNLNEIQDLIKFVSKAGVSEVEIERKDFKIIIKAESKVKEQVFVQAAPQVMQAAPVAAPVTAAPAAASASPVDNAPVIDDSKLITIKSPMIGTFYRSSSPDKDAFAQVGATIQKGSPVCIIEAMKLFNEIESEVSGKIVKVLVEDASPVEYDQPLFLVDPS